MDYFTRKSLSKYLITDTIDFNKHVHDIDIFINDKWRKYAGGDIGRLFKITRRLELRFWPTRKRSQPSQGDFFTWITLQREPWSGAKHQNSKSILKFFIISRLSGTFSEVTKLSLTHFDVPVEFEPPKFYCFRMLKSWGFMREYEKFFYDGLVYVV